jgi:hypothetical protein
VSKLRLTNEGLSDKGAARRAFLLEQKLAAQRQRALESDSGDDTSDSDEDINDGDDQDVAMAKMVAEDE